MMKNSQQTDHRLAPSEEVASAESASPSSDARSQGLSRPPPPPASTAVTGVVESTAPAHRSMARSAEERTSTESYTRHRPEESSSPCYGIKMNKNDFKSYKSESKNDIEFNCL